MDDAGVPFLKCEYNRDGDSWRSPFSNTYIPPLEEDAEDAFYPTGNLLEMEQKANSLLREYAKLYFEDCITSVYFFEIDGGFGASFLIKKNRDGFGGAKVAEWDSIHSFTVQQGAEDNFSLVSTIFLDLELEDESTGTGKIAGTYTREVSKKHASETDTTALVA